MGDIAQRQMFPVRPSSGRPPDRAGSFVDNMRLPIHRWFRFSAGFSAEWVHSLLAPLDPKVSRVLDPFVGSGTTLLAAEALGIDSFGFEAHPFLVRIARAKLRWHHLAADLLRDGNAVLVRAKEIARDIEPPTSELLARCYEDASLQKLCALRTAWEGLSTQLEEGSSEILWLAITSILRETSHVGTANWQYLLPNKRKSQVKDPYSAFADRVALMADDMAFAQDAGYRSSALVIQADARDPDTSLDGSIQWVITSPPYPNNFDYADATRLEMTFWGEVERWSDLHGAVRRHLVRACTQHATADSLDLADLLRDPVLEPILEELSDVCNELAVVRETRGGKKSYHTMVAGYFLDLADVWHGLRRLCAPGAQVCFVVGDSAPYGVHVPADRWLGELAIAAGFHGYRFEKIRDRNTKWKNRKHRVPLMEGRLWVDG